jgi:TonB-linked SusC/RagA family outer membrane protein
MTNKILSSRFSLKNLAGTLLTILLFQYSLSASAGIADKRGLDTKITLKVTNMPVAEVLKKINQMVNIDFAYGADALSNSKKVSLNVKEEKLSDVLSKILSPFHMEYYYSKNLILIQMIPEASRHPVKNIIPTKQSRVSGTVRDAKGISLPGVSVKLKNGTAAASTNAEGKYSVSLPDGNGDLIFTSIGFITQEVPVNGRTIVDVTLKEESQALTEVVVTALGIAREKKALAYAVTEVKGEVFTKARENNLGNALAGRVAGVNATSTATGAGGSSRVIIRGNGSLSGENQPLYVVNGVPMTNNTPSAPGTYGGVDRGDGLNSINPDDIESISVLKGGTAAALYGSRAANGVILITTKTGKGQLGLGVEYNTTYTMETPLSTPDWQYEYGSGDRGLKPTSRSEAIANGRISWGAKLDGSAVVNTDGVSRPYVAQKNNIQNFYDTGNTFSNTLALTGGNETSNFRFSASNMDNKGIVPNAAMNRKTFSLSASANLSKKVIFEGNVQFNIEKNKNRSYIADFTKNPNASVGLIATSLDVRTLAPGYDAQGFEVPWNDYVFVVNPYFAVNKVKNEDERKRFIGSFSTRYNITDYLYARGRLGIDYFNTNGFDINPSGILTDTRGSMTTDRNTTYETNAEALLGFDKTFGKFSVNALIGGNQMHSQVRAGSLSSGLFNVPFTYFIGNGSSQTFLDIFSESAINSLFSSADIGFNNYLYLNLTGRKDWFSTLSMKNNSLFYPSAGVSFILSNAWTAKPSWLSYAKIRSSWAQVGGGAPNPYSLSLTYTAQSVTHLGQPLQAITGSNIPSELKPYTSTTTEAGIETRMFNNRFGVDLTVYDRTTTNDIVNAAVAVSSSFNSVSLNVGKMRNRGIELLLTGTPLRSANGLNYEVSFNMAYNDNKVINIAEDLDKLALPGATPRTENAYVYHYAGQSFGMIAGNKARTDANGNVIYNSANGIPLQSEIVPLGKGVPPLTMGISNTFSYKNLSLGFLIDGKFGAKMYTSTNAYGTYYGLDKRTAENGVRESGITVTGVDETGAPFSRVVSAQDYYQGIAYTLTDQFVYDASFIKLRQITLGYSVPKKLLAKTPVQSASLSLVARNLLLIYSSVPNVDPESTYNNSNAQGLENFGVPTTRSYGLNLSVKF